MKKVQGRILVIDRDAGHRAGLVQFLLDKHIVQEVQNFDEAKNTQSKEIPPDLVITDIQLRDGDTREVKDRVELGRLLPWTRDIPVIGMLPEHRKPLADQPVSGAGTRTFDSPPFELISKPVDLTELERLVQRSIDRRHRFRPALSRIGKEWLPPILVFTLFLIFWEFACRFFEVKEYLVPPPSRVAGVMYENWHLLMEDTLVTMAESFLGFLLANAASLLIAILFAHSRWFERSFYPYMIGLKSVPVIAIAPLLVLWLGYGITSKVVMAAIIAFFPLVVNATVGLKSVDAEALDLLHSLSASRTQILLKLRFPNAVPHIFSALKISSALAVVGAIVGELTGARRGIGFTILISSYNIDTPLLFAAIVLASLTGIFFFALVSLFEKLVVKDSVST